MQVAGIDDIPTSATAFVGNVTAVGNSSGSGYLAVYPDIMPTTSDVNFTTGATAANMVIGQLSSSGTVTIATGASGNVNVLVDVSGWFTAATS